MSEQHDATVGVLTSGIDDANLERTRATRELAHIHPNEAPCTAIISQSHNNNNNTNIICGVKKSLGNVSLKSIAGTKIILCFNVTFYFVRSASARCFRPASGLFSLDLRFTVPGSVR